jgi:hypothetical protein
MHRIRSGVVAVAGICSVLGCADAVSEALPQSVRACMGETDDARRLACFDRETARLIDKPAPVAASAPATPAAAAASAPAQQAAAPARPQEMSDEEKFGYRGNLARKDVDRRKTEAEGVEQLTAKVVEVSAAPHGEFVAKLDNGQVWQQKLIDRVRVRVGDEVTIRRASFGSFMLVTPTGKSTRVARIE